MNGKRFGKFDVVYVLIGIMLILDAYLSVIFNACPDDELFYHDLGRVIRLVLGIILVGSPARKLFS